MSCVRDKERGLGVVIVCEKHEGLLRGLGIDIKVVVLCRGRGFRRDK